MTTPRCALAYVRVSTLEQRDSGAGLAAQRAAVEAEAARRGWELLEIVEDAATSATLDRPGVVEVLARLDRREADVVIVAKLDRLTRSVRDFADLCERATRRGWAIVALDLGVDTTTPVGELVANITASTAQYERRLIGQRTREALAAKRAAGVHLGRPAALPAAVVERIVAERAGGASLRAIAAGLDRDGVSTAHGGTRWHASTVRDVLRSQAAALPQEASA